MFNKIHWVIKAVQSTWHSQECVLHLPNQLYWVKAHVSAQSFRTCAFNWPPKQNHRQGLIQDASKHPWRSLFPTWPFNWCVNGRGRATTSDFISQVVGFHAAWELLGSWVCLYTAAQSRIILWFLNFSPGKHLLVVRSRGPIRGWSVFQSSCALYIFLFGAFYSAQRHTSKKVCLGKFPAIFHT